MKKYWPVLSLIIVSIIGLTFYYIDMAKATNLKLQFQFETLEGDDKHLDDLIVQTSYDAGRKYANYFVEKQNATPVENRYREYIEDYSMLQLIEEHKNFFRAKQLTARHYYNDEQSLAYVYINDQYNYDHPGSVQYEVEVMDKETEERRAFKLVGKVDKPYLWQTVEWVSYKDGELKVLSVRQLDNHREAVLLTTFDLQEEAMNETVLVDGKKKFHFTFHHQMANYNNNDIALFSEYNNDISEGTPAQQLYQYNVSTNAMQAISMEQFEQAFDYSFSIYKNTLTAYATNHNELSIKLIDLNTMDQQDYLIPLALSNKEGYIDNLQLLEDKMYIYYSVDKGAALEVVDVQSGDKLYAGLLTVANITNKHHLYIQTIHKK